MKVFCDKYDIRELVSLLELSRDLDNESLKDILEGIKPLESLELLMGLNSEAKENPDC